MTWLLFVSFLAELAQGRVGFDSTQGSVFSPSASNSNLIARLFTFDLYATSRPDRSSLAAGNSKYERMESTSNKPA
jgi:hypothetical protein